MSWKDFFYFSKGERRALTLLLGIISLSLLLLILKDYYSIEKYEEKKTDQIVYKREDSISITQDSIPKQQSVERKVLSKPKFSPKPKLSKPVPGYTQKYSKGTIIELNSADTIILKKIPGIGSSFANRISKYRDRLGGYYSVQQLREVYGIDEEKYKSLCPWFTVDTTKLQKLRINDLAFGELLRHPYLNKKQVRVITNLRDRKGKLSGWENLRLLEEFTENDQKKLIPYISFE